MTAPRSSRIRSALSSVFFNPYKRAALLKTELGASRRHLADTEDSLLRWANKFYAEKRHKEAALAAEARERQRASNISLNWADIHKATSDQLEAAEMACEDFMRDREELKQANEGFLRERNELKMALAVHTAAGLALTNVAVEQNATIEALNAFLDEFASTNLEVADALKEARETEAQTVSYVKAVEAKLADMGVTVTDAKDGTPVVNVNTVKVVLALREGRAVSVKHEIAA